MQAFLNSTFLISNCSEIAFPSRQADPFESLPPTLGAPNAVHPTPWLFSYGRGTPVPYGTIVLWLSCDLLLTQRTTEKVCESSLQGYLAHNKTPTP